MPVRRDDQAVCDFTCRGGVVCCLKVPRRRLAVGGKAFCVALLCVSALGCSANLGKHTTWLNIAARRALSWTDSSKSFSLISAHEPHDPACSCAHTHAQAHTCACEYTHTHTHVHKHTHKHTRARAHPHTHTHTKRKVKCHEKKERKVTKLTEKLLYNLTAFFFSAEKSACLSVSNSLCPPVCLPVPLSVCLSLCLSASPLECLLACPLSDCMYVCVCVYIYIYTYICMYIYTHTR